MMFIFAYEKDREILKGITMNFPANSFISFVGESGCGKSTLAGILTARNRGYTGSVKIGGVDISDIMENELMSHMTKITHNSYLFAGTVKENLRMAKPDAKQRRDGRSVRESKSSGIFKRTGMDYRLSCQKRGGKTSQVVRDSVWHLQERCCLIHQSTYFDEATSNIDMEK